MRCPLRGNAGLPRDAKAIALRERCVASRKTTGAVHGSTAAVRQGAVAVLFFRTVLSSTQLAFAAVSWTVSPLTHAGLRYLWPCARRPKRICRWVRRMIDFKQALGGFRRNSQS